MQGTLLLGVAFALSAPALKEPSKKLDKLVGDWEVVALTLGGQKLNLNGVHIFYRFTSDDRWAQWYKDGDPPALARFTASPKGNPQAIDLHGRRGENQTSMLGIIGVEDDTLTLCVGDSRARPTKFESTVDSKCILYVLRRVKEN